VVEYTYGMLAQSDYPRMSAYNNGAKVGGLYAKTVPEIFRLYTFSKNFRNLGILDFRHFFL